MTLGAKKPLLGQGFQEKLISGRNIKTVDSTSLLGTGDVPIPEGGGSVSDYDAPAPTVTITPDSADTNPASYYHAVYGLKVIGESSVRSLISEEIVTSEGEDTTQVILASTDYGDFDALFVIRGTESNVYTERIEIATDALPADVFGGFIALEEGELDELVAKSVLEYAETTKAAVESVLTGPITSHQHQVATTDEAVAALLTANDGAGNAVAGTKYAFPFTTRHYLTDGLSAQANVWEDLPLPTGITIVPDAVGDNPTSYFYRVLFRVAAGQTPVGGISPITDEIEEIRGDSTTESIFSIGNLPDGFLYYLYLGTVSGVYTHFTIGNANPNDIFNYESTFDTVEEGVNDYATISALPQGKYDTGVPDEVTGTTETIIVTATSPNTIDKRVQSVEYPDDIIEYDWNPANWLDNINFATDGTIISGFKGVITYRKDTKQNNSAGFDFRNAKNRLWSIAQAEWAADPGTYSEGELVQITIPEIPDEQDAEIQIYVALDSCVGTDVPGVATDKWKHLISATDPLIFDHLSFNSTNGIVIKGIAIPVLDATDYIDVTVFSSNYEYIFNCHIAEGAVDSDVILNQ